MQTKQRIALLVGAVVVVVVAFVIASSTGGSGKLKTTTGVAHVVVVNAKPKGGISKLVYNKGQRVHFTVTSDVADEIHVHGYNYKQEVRKNGTVAFDFPATIGGVFVIELESRAQQIASLVVQ